MFLKTEEILKFDKKVREKYLTAQMRKVFPDFLTWSMDYRIVATLSIVDGKVVFKWE